MILVTPRGHTIVNMKAISTVYIDEENNRFMIFAINKKTGEKIFIHSCRSHKTADSMLMGIMKHWSEDAKCFNMYEEYHTDY